MKKVLEQYLKDFARIKPKLEEYGFTLTEHYWSADGFNTAFWNENEKPCIPLEKRTATMNYVPEFRSRNADNKRMHLNGQLGNQCEDFWILDLCYFPETTLNPRGGFMGPVAKLEICQIMEEDIDKIPEFMDKLKSISRLL